MTRPPEVELLYRMVEIPSPSGREGALARFLAAAGSELGLRTAVDRVGNLLARTGRGGDPVILLVSHLDTVDDPVPASVADGWVAGRGAVDAKGPLAAMLLAAASRPDFPGTLVVAGVVEEEVPGSRGAVHLRATLPRPDAVLIGEPSGWSTVVLGYKGILDLSYRVRRPATHPTNPAEKATEAAAAFWADAVAVLGPHASHAAFDRPAVTLGRMAGDMAEAGLRLSYRLPLGFDSAALVDRLRGLARGGDVEVLFEVPAVRTDRRDIVVRALTAAIRRTGGEPRYKLKTATSDMNVLAQAWDMPMAAYGPGDSRLDHCSTERIRIDDFRRGIAVIGTALDELAERLAVPLGQPARRLAVPLGQPARRPAARPAPCDHEEESV